MKNNWIILKLSYVLPHNSFVPLDEALSSITAHEVQCTFRLLLKMQYFFVSISEVGV